MIIRKGQVRDKRIVSGLIIEAIEDLSNIFTGYDEDKAIIEEMEKLYVEKGNRFSLDYCRVIEEDGRTVASVIAYPAADMAMLNESIISRLRLRFGHDDDKFHRYSRRIRNSREAFDGEYYIDNLAVLEACRGRGYSRILLESIEREALEKGYQKVSILADINNDRAFGIYRKLGYEKDCELDVLGHRYHHLVKSIDSKPVCS